jgi:hypothetical protein
LHGPETSSEQVPLTTVVSNSSDNTHGYVLNNFEVDNIKQKQNNNGTCTNQGPAPADFSTLYVEASPYHHRLIEKEPFLSSDQNAITSFPEDYQQLCAFPDNQGKSSDL